MSAAVLKCLASAAATSLYDAVGVAETAAELDNLAKLAWCGIRDGAISEDDAHHLLEYIHRRRPVPRAKRQQTLPGLPLPPPNLQRIGRFPKRHAQRSPNKQASYERRKQLAYSGVMPRELVARLTVARLTVAEMAVMRVVADEYLRVGCSELTLGEIAARAGVCRETAKRAVSVARDERLITVEIRPVRGRKNRPNRIEVISFEWLKWLHRSRTRQPQAGEPIGEHFVAPTKNTTIEDDDPNPRDNPGRREAAAQPQSGRPNKEAIELAAELETICGHRQATVPKSWRDANPPQVVQVWLNELARSYQRPADALRSLATKVMRRKRLRDASPPYSPRYFSAEVKKLVACSRSERSRCVRNAQKSDRTP